MGIRDGTLHVEQGLLGTPDLPLTADSATWVRFARKETPLILAMLRGKVRVHGPLRLLKRFGARARHPERWSRDTRDWTPAGPVRLNPTPAVQELKRID